MKGFENTTFLVLYNVWMPLLTLGGVYIVSSFGEEVPIELSCFPYCLNCTFPGYLQHLLVSIHCGHVNPNIVEWT